MRRLMPTHHGSPGKYLPPRALIDALVDYNSTGDHHLWNGDFEEEDDLRYAVFPWSPPAKPSVRYCVARVLWFYENDVTLIRRNLRNMCGLTTCVNPAHYEREITEADLNLVTLPDGFMFDDGIPAVLVRFEGGTPHVHIWRTDSSYLACYRSTLPSRAAQCVVPNGTPITCSKCVSEWRNFQRPLLRLS